MTDGPNPQNPWDKTHEIVKEIRETIGPALRQREQGALLYRYTGKPRPRLEIFVDPRGRARMTLSLRRDGTISARSGRKDLSRTKLLHHHHSLALQLEREMAGKLLGTALRTPLARKNMPNIMVQEGPAEYIGFSARETALEIMKQLMQKAEMSGRTVQTDWTKRVSTLNDVIRKNMVNLQALKLAEAILDEIHQIRQHVTIHQYNRTLVNLDAFLEISRAAPNILILHEALMGNEPAQKLGAPEEIAHRLRANLGLSNAGWKLFARCGWNLNTSTTARDLTLGYQMVTLANRPGAPEKIVRTIAGMTSLHLRTEEAGRDGQNCQRAWVHIINQALIQERCGSTEELTRINDALRWHIANQIPWGPTDWDSYVRRSNRWHEEQNESQRKTERSAQWESAIGATQAGGFTVTPITTGGGLIDLGSRMQNCLGSYVKYCLQGKDRIFTLHRGNKFAAAAQITRDGDAWKTGQIRELENAMPGEDAARAMIEICRAYALAEAGKGNPKA